MKIGILTFHNAHNYGAVLQAYALQYVLTDLGCEVEIIDYRNRTIDKFHDYWSFKNNSIATVLYRLLFSYNYLRTKERNFCDFTRQFLHLSKERYDHVNIPYGYDLYIVGSDQVWNPLITGGLDPYYWGELLKDDRIISYAASSGNMNKLSSDDLKSIQHYLSNFSSISVRENRLKDFLSSKFSVPSQVVLDPTLLAGRECFEKICADRVIDEPYVLVYRVESNPHLREIAYAVASNFNAKLVEIGLDTWVNKRKYPSVKFVNPSVAVFLSLFKHAECVVSLSFHGTAFSLLFEKEFYSVKGGNMERVSSVLKPLGLLDRIVNSAEGLIFLKIDYECVRERLFNLALRSKSFIYDSLL